MDLGKGEPLVISQQQIVLTGDVEETKRRLRDICVATVGHWKNLLPNQPMHCEFLPGGITNSLYRCWTDDQFSVVVRIFGDDTETIIDRRREEQITTGLSKLGFGKLIYGEFSNGRVEEWVNGRSITLAEMAEPAISVAIAKRLAEMHSVRLCSSVLNSTKSSMWATLDTFIEKAGQVESAANPAQQQVLKTIDMKTRMSQLSTLRTNLISSSQSPIVLAHNDLLCGNIIVDKATPVKHNIQFIDFEYAGYNYRGFDIANHFCEICGFECAWDKFPSKKFQRTFFREYLASLTHADADTIDDKVIDAMQDEVDPWILVSHMWWGFWSIAQSGISTIDFDFLDYAQRRFTGFDLHSNTG